MKRLFDFGPVRKSPQTKRLYSIWTSMKSRCSNPNAFAYSRYGGRGIKVCDEWKESFYSFYYWALSNGYSDDLTLDRIDNDGNYCPSNCRWTTKIQQGNNTSQNVWLTYGDECHTISEWSRITGGTHSGISRRLKEGGPIEEIIFGRPNRRKNNYHKEK